MSQHIVIIHSGTSTSRQDAFPNVVQSTAEGFNINLSIHLHVPTLSLHHNAWQLHEEKIALYGRMLKEKHEMMGRLERLIRGR